MRWALDLQCYDVIIEYVKGSANKVADALSRCDLIGRVESEESEEKTEIERVIN